MLEWLNSKWQSEYVIPKWHGGLRNSKQTAIRETSEENMIRGERPWNSKIYNKKLNYTFTAWYREDNPLVDKDVYLFLIKYKWTQEPIPQKEERFIWYKWFGIDEIKNSKVKFDLPSIISKNKVYFI